MTVVKRCASLEDAYMIKNLLEAGGVGADILDEATASTAPYLLASSGIRVTVADEDFQEAKEILGLPAEPESLPRKSSSNMPWVAALITVIALVALISFSQQNSKVTGERKTERDRNGDHKADVRISYDASGHPMLALYDENFDGRWDERMEYESGIRVKGMVDRDRDGTFDVVETFNQGILASELVTPGGAGFPLFRYVFREGIQESRWEDTDRDGTWDLRTDYDVMGRETSRAPMK